MSKMDALRAMREARYAAAQKGSSTGTPRSTPRPAASAKPAAAAAGPAEGLCGFKAISGKTCTREKGHAAKSHRYS